MKNSHDVNGVLNLYNTHAAKINAIHLANIYGTLARSVQMSNVTKLRNDDRFIQLLKTTNDKLHSNPEKFGVRSIATVTHSLGKLKICDHQFLNEIINNHERIAKSGEPQALSNICWAFAKLDFKADALFHSVAGQHVKIVRDGNVQAMSNICWAFATVGHEAEDLFKAVAAQHGRFVRDGTAQAVANTLWSFAIAGYLDEGRDLVEKLWNRACDGRLQFNDENLRQLALFYASAQIEEPNLNLEPPPESLLGQIEAAAAKQGVTDSREQNLVSSTLKELNIDHKMEVSPFESSNVTFNTFTMLNIDIVFSTKNKKKIAMEFNGPSHYVQSKGIDFESGTTKFKRRLLGRLGYTVMSIYWDDWRRVSETGETQAFLKNSRNFNRN